jgi:AAA family ATP:ADP antiporter
MVVRRALQRAVQVHDHEVAALLLSTAYVFLLFAGYFIIRPVRDEMGMAGGVDDLAWLFSATLLGMLAVHPVYAALVARLGRRRFIPVAYRFFGLNLLAFFVLLETVPAGSQLWVGRVFFVWTSVFNLFVVSVFWSFMADLFRAEQGRRLFGFIAVGATLGGVAGSAITSMLVELLGTAPLLVVSAAALEAALVCVRALLRGAAASQPEGLQPERPIGGSALAGIRSVARSPYLLAICGYMLVYTVTSTFLYFQQAEIVPAALGGDRAARTAYLAHIDLAVNLATVVVQTLLAGRIVRRIGIAAALAVLPAVTAAGFLGLAAAPGLGVLAIVKVLRRTANYAIARPCREVLYTVLAREDKYKAKHFIDTFVYRAGDQVGAWSHAAARGLGLAVTGIAVAAVPLSVIWGAIALWLGRRQRRLEQEGWRSPNEG